MFKRVADAVGTKGAVERFINGVGEDSLVQHAEASALVAWLRLGMTMYRCPRVGTNYTTYA